MKKYLFFAAIAIAAFVSCQKEIVRDEVSVKPGFVKITLSAQSDVDSKASLNGNQVVWEVGEKVAVFTAADTAPLEFNVDKVEGTAVQFSGEIPAGTESFVAAYPFASAKSWDKAAVVAMNVANQTVTAAQSVDPKALASVAWFSNADATPVFKNTLALLKFTVGVDGVKRVKIATESKGAIAGNVSVTVSETDAPVVASASAAVIEVACEDGFTKDAPYYAAVIPSEYKGFYVNTYVGEDVKLLYTAAEGEIKRNDVLNLGDVATGAKVVDMITEITNAEELAFFLKHAAKYESDAVVKIANDIDLTGATLTTATSFAGTLDGQGFSLKNWVSDGVSLFAENKGTVKDFTIDASCQISLPAELSNFGIVATSSIGTVSGITNNADLTGTDVTVKGGRLGSIVGVATAPAKTDALLIDNCVNNGKITITTVGNTGGTQYVGGIVGSMGYSALNYVRDCINNGDVTIACSGKNTKNFYIGGIAGGTTNGSNNLRLKNNGDLTFTCNAHEAAICLAGITSYSTGEIIECENTGDITFKSNSSFKATFVGGLAGYYATASMSNSVNRGNISVTAGYILGRNSIGELDGSKSYNGTNAISAGLTVGGLISGCGSGVVVNDSENFGDVTVLLNDPFNSSMGTHTAARPSFGGCVGDCSGPLTNVHNHGKVSVMLDNGGTGSDGKNAGYMFYVGGIVGSSYNWSGASTSGGSDTNYANKFTLTNCDNTGDVYFYSDYSRDANSAVGGIAGWPGSENATPVYVADGCDNSGNITIEGKVKVRAGGIHGGTGRMKNCVNTGNVTLNSCRSNSVAGGLAGYHGSGHIMENCTAECTVEAKVACNGIGGLVANHGNQANSTGAGCRVNCELIGGPATSTGLIIGLFNGTSAAITFGTSESPIKIAGSVDGVAVDPTNYEDLIHGSKNYTDGVHVFYVDFPKPALERVWGFYKEGTTPWYATSNITAVSIANPDGYGMARGLAMDDEYIYLPKASAYANVAAVSIADKTVQKALNKTGVSGGSTFATSFVRMIKNTDSSVNGGKDVLLLCNLTSTNSDENQLKLYAYKDGVDAAPTKIAAFCWDGANSVNDWRRYGDRFFVTGTWSEGKVYFPSFDANKTVVLSIANGARTAVTQIAAGSDNSPSGIKDITVYPGDNKLFLTNGSIANLVAPTGGLANGWDEYTLSASSDNGKNTWGYNFFEFNGKNYIAYARIIGETKAQIEVIEDKGDLVSSLAAKDGLMVSPIHDAVNLDAEVGSGNLADCCVRIIGGVPYIAALTRDGGFVLDKIVMK